MTLVQVFLLVLVEEALLSAQVDKSGNGPEVRFGMNGRAHRTSSSPPT